MRFPSFSAIIRTFCTFTNATSHVVRPTQPSVSPFLRGTILRSMPTVPFLGSLFSSSSAGKMSYPLEKSEDEWSAVLNKGNKTPLWNSSTPALMLIKVFSTRTIPRSSRKGHRSPVHRHLRQTHAIKRRLHMCCLRRSALQSHAQVQIRLRLAGLLRLDPRRGDETYRPHLWHGTHRDRVQQLRWPFGPRFQGRGLSDPDRRAALCE